MGNYNVGVVVYVNFTANFDKLIQVKNEIEVVLIAKYGEEAVNATRIRKSEEYENYSMGIFVNVPEKPTFHIELKEQEETKEDASGE